MFCVLGMLLKLPLSYHTNVYQQSSKVSLGKIYSFLSFSPSLLSLPLSPSLLSLFLYSLSFSIFLHLHISSPFHSLPPPLSLSLVPSLYLSLSLKHLLLSLSYSPLSFFLWHFLSPPFFLSLSLSIFALLSRNRKLISRWTHTPCLHLSPFLSYFYTIVCSFLSFIFSPSFSLSDSHTTVRSILLTEQGLPVITLSSSSSFTYNTDMQSWLVSVDVLHS